MNNLPATKADLDKAVAKLATKDELKAAVAKLATKEELKTAVAKLATKEELKREVAKLATKDELNAVEKRLNEKIDGSERAIRAGLQIDLEEFREEINEKLGRMPTKDEFFTRIDKVMGELQTTRDQQVLLSVRSSDHEDRIELLEQTAGIAAA